MVSFMMMISDLVLDKCVGIQKGPKVAGLCWSLFSNWTANLYLCSMWLDVNVRMDTKKTCV